MRFGLGGLRFNDNGAAGPAPPAGGDSSKGAERERSTPLEYPWGFEVSVFCCLFSFSLRLRRVCVETFGTGSVLLGAEDARGALPQKGMCLIGRFYAPAAGFGARANLGFDAETPRRRGTEEAESAEQAGQAGRQVACLRDSGH
jgi:hypothetical protein